MQQPGPDEISVTVIVPAFNLELFIEQRLRSLFEQAVDRLIARAQATSRLARMSSRRRLRGTGSDSGARRVPLD